MDQWRMWLGVRTYHYAASSSTRASESAEAETVENAAGEK